MAGIVILANSKRPDGQCIGGIDLDTGDWVRPVTSSGDGIPASRCIVNGKYLKLRDILELDLARLRQIPKYQWENRLILNWKWQVKKRLKLEAVEKYVEDITPILHSQNDRVAPAVLDELSPKKWKSLQLVKPRKLRFSRHYYSPNRWVAEFQDRAGNSYSLKITDPDVTRRLENDDAISKKCLLTISMTKPWTANPAEMPPRCYKVVAAVIELE
jgi:hypothetical protein